MTTNRPREAPHRSAATVGGRYATVARSSGRGGMLFGEIGVDLFTVPPIDVDALRERLLARRSS